MNYLSSISKQTWIIIAVVILVIILIIYFSKKQKSLTTTTTTITPAVTVPVTSSGNGFPIQIGSSGSNVTKWQKYLNTKGASLKEDGIWGPLTEAASLKYMGFNSVTEQYFNTVIK